MRKTPSSKTPKSQFSPWRGFVDTLGPGLITGASDDDPSGIGTYSQAGAQLGFGIGWTMLLTYPLMVAIQEISARIGRITGYGIAGNVCRHFPAPLLWPLLFFLFAANTVNIAADLAATLSLFAYVIALAAVKVPWGEALRGIVLPSIQLSGDFLTTLVAILGTTISPYLFVWQSAQEAEEQREDPAKRPLKRHAKGAASEFRRIRLDTLTGMAFSNLIGLSIMITTAATLHAHGQTDIQSSSQAAKALEPLAGRFAELIFAVGIIGTGLLAIPVLAGSTAYAVAEGRQWPVGLARKPKEAAAFYTVLAISGLLGIAPDFAPIDPIKALYWSAVINGVLAAPIMVVVMILVRRQTVMGNFVVRGWLYWLGWASTVAMAFCIVGMGVGLFTG